MWAVFITKPVLKCQKGMMIVCIPSQQATTMLSACRPILTDLAYYYRINLHLLRHLHRLLVGIAFAHANVAVHGGIQSGGLAAMPSCRICCRASSTSLWGKSCVSTSRSGLTSVTFCNPHNRCVPWLVRMSGLRSFHGLSFAGTVSRYHGHLALSGRWPPACWTSFINCRHKQRSSLKHMVMHGLDGFFDTNVYVTWSASCSRR